MTAHGFFLAVGFVFAIILFRYFLLVGAFWLVFYQMRPKRFGQRQIYTELPSFALQKYEIKWSVATSVIFALSGVVMGVMWQLGWTQIYLKMDLYGWFYFFFSLILISVVHDFYFYWTHRWLHIPRVFKKFHAIHHESMTPSPWASFSFHPVEGLIQAAALPLIILIIPVHPVSLIIYLTLMTISAITNHLGFEVLPENSETGIGQWLISGVHHTMHHRYYRHNFGLFYTFFDRFFKTEHPNFKQDFKKVFEKNRT